jgi:hypothetical protein
MALPIKSCDTEGNCFSNMNNKLQNTINCAGWRTGLFLYSLYKNIPKLCNIQRLSKSEQPNIVRKKCTIKFCHAGN